MSYEIKKMKMDDELRRANLLDDVSFLKISEDLGRYQMDFKISNSYCPLNILIDNSVITLIDIYLGKLTDISKKEKIINLFNDFNSEGQVFTFYLDSSYCMHERMYYYNCEDEKFDAYELISLAVAMYRNIEEHYYQKMMRIIWL